MRTLEQCKAEVFRRSRRRILRRHMLWGCVPVALALTLVLALPARKAEQAPDGSDGMVEEMATQTVPLTLQIRQGEQCRDITDPERIQALYQMLTGGETVGSSGTTESPNYGTPQETVTMGSSGTTESPNYGTPQETVLVFYDAGSGQTFTYCFAGERCYRKETGQFVSLTPQQRQELEELL